jgi:hypothetical protein
MRRNPLASLLSRLLLALALIAPHAARSDGAGGFTLVICGADGPYEIALGDGSAAPTTPSHDCCVLCAPAFRAAPPPLLPPRLWSFAPPASLASAIAVQPSARPDYRPRDSPLVA